VGTGWRFPGPGNYTLSYNVSKSGQICDEINRPISIAIDPIPASFTLNGNTTINTLYACQPILFTSTSPISASVQAPQWRIQVYESIAPGISCALPPNAFSLKASTQSTTTQPPTNLDLKTLGTNVFVPGKVYRVRFTVWTCLSPNISQTSETCFSYQTQQAVSPNFSINGYSSTIAPTGPRTIYPCEEVSFLDETTGSAQVSSWQLDYEYADENCNAIARAGGPERGIGRPPKVRNLKPFF